MDAPRSLVGERIGHYVVSRPIGAGGMGEVYEAHDSKLGRSVAVKLLPPDVASHDRLERFEREARILALLNHPNIAAIYGLESLNGQPALILELVPGDTLAEVISRGPLPLSTSLSYAVQIADALDAAHDKGIIHRDLKPANIKLTLTGGIKLLDFGLAKGSEAPETVQSEVPTAVTPATRPGTVMGTVAYMSPEQARGLPVDRRTDVWAFGCLFYEMLTGKLAFQGATSSDVLVAVLERQPDWSLLPETTPPPVIRLLRRCLEKDPRNRLRDIGDARFELSEPEGGAKEQSGSRPVATKAPSRTIAVALMGMLIGAAVAAVGLSGIGTDLTAPATSRAIRLTSGPNREFGPAISPDGKWIAYVATTAPPTNTTDVWVKFLSGGEPVNLTANADLDISQNTGISGIDIAPEGNRIAVMAKPRGSSASFATWEIPAPLPGVPRKLLDDTMLGARWSPDGKQLVFIRAGASAGDALWRADSDGSNRREIVPAGAGVHIHWPAPASDGYVYFIRTRSTIANLDQADIYRVRMEGGQPEPVVQSTRRVMYPMPSSDGRTLMYAGDRSSADLSLWWQPIGKGVATPLTRGIGDYSEARLSADGRAIVATFSDLRQSLERLDLSGQPTATTGITSGFDRDLDPSISPTGTRVFFSSARSGNRSIWSADLDGSRARPITGGEALDQWPAVSPDGQQVAFVSDRGGRRGIWIVSSEGGSPRQVAQAESIGGLSWSRDGRTLTFAAENGQWPGLHTVRVADGHIERIPTEGVATDPARNPVDDSIAFLSPATSGPTYTSVAMLTPSGAVKPIPPSPRIPSGFSNGVLAWSPDGRKLAIVSQNSNSNASLWILDLGDDHPDYVKIMDFAPGPRLRGMTWTPDGKSLVFGKHDTASDIVLLDLSR